MPTLAVFNGTARLSTYLIPKALKAGYDVRAIVRSTSRFYHKVDKHDQLSAHELRDVSDVEPLQSQLKGVDVLVLAAGIPLDEPTTLQQDMVHSCVAAIRANIKDGSTPPSVLMLSSAPLSPLMDFEGTSTEPNAKKANLMAKFLRYQMLVHEYDDQERAMRYLEKQSSWLKFQFILPGGILDVSEPEEETVKWRLSTTEMAFDLVITYERLAGAMLGCIDGGLEQGRYVVPIPTSKVKAGFGDMETARANAWSWLKKAVVFPALKGGVMVGIGLVAGLVTARSR